MHRQLSRHLIGLWTYDCDLTDKLMRRVLPAGLLDFLNSEEEVPEKEIDRMHGRDNLKVNPMLMPLWMLKCSTNAISRPTMQWHVMSWLYAHC